MVSDEDKEDDQISNDTSGKSISVKEAAEFLGKSQQFIRVGLQSGILPFGSAVKLSTKWTYYISASKLYDFAGIKPIKEGEVESGQACSG